MKVKILGAARNVTGSKFLLEINRYRIMIDCGLYQEREFKDRNWQDFPVNPSSINSIILTHAHLDHCGYLPKLVREGFKGNIYCTEPTSEIVRITLMDSGKIQEEDALQKRQRHEKEGIKKLYPIEPLYTASDAEKVFPLVKGFPYKKDIQITEGISAAFYDAGHILGAAMVKLKIIENGRLKKIIFSGDIGRWNKPIICDPTLFEEADTVFVESTYGNRIHETEKEAGKKLAMIINKTCRKNGNIVIPTFAIERAQEILFFVSKFLKENIIPHLLVFMDSPMAINITEVFKKYPEYLDNETRALINKGHSPFDFAMLKTTTTVDESKAINHIKGSSIIIAGSGMCTGGRIKHHLVKNITRPESTIAFVGYQAKGTLGRTILEKPKNVRILGRVYPVRASIENIEGFSAHADRNDLMRWMKGFKKPPQKIFVVHGEEEASADFASLLKAKLKSEIFIPAYLDEFTL